MRARRLLLGALALAALGGAAEFAVPTASAGDDEQRLLAAPESAPDAERLRRAAEEALEKDPKDGRAMRALLLAVGRLRDRDLLDDAIERGRPFAESAAARDVVRINFGTALLRRARLDEPPARERLEEAARYLAGANPDGRPEEWLDLAHARHLLGQPGARDAYRSAIESSSSRPADEATADRAVEGLRSLAGTDVQAYLDSIQGEHWALARARARMLLATGRVEKAVEALTSPRAARSTDVYDTSPRLLALRGEALRLAGHHTAALKDERKAVQAAGTVAKGGWFVLTAVETLWREKRPLASFADCDELTRDYDRLVAAADGFPDTQMAWLNNVAFRLREVVSVYTWRGEGRSQGIAAGAPKEVHALLARCVALYDGAVSKIPKDDPGASFETRWTRAGVCNDAGLMRHYFVDVRDLARAEALYLRAFDLTDGAYMDTYFYNLQYLYGFEMPGKEEAWFRLAQRARSQILAEAPGGGFVPDERKRDAASRDAEALRRLLETRAGR